MGFYAPAQIVSDARTNRVQLPETHGAWRFAQNTPEPGSKEY